ncbi:MAG: short-chain dehydrogenase [Rhizobiales bacterium 65-79]|nr:SDR family oxidoreductase [Hyphomicrobiales bacterium]OJU05331.1 MAG: short-chain dehydrogenase [Rhizobiales bacterium 65-79]
MTGLFSHRRIFVSGAGNGIGLACVRRFIDAGASVACFDRDAEALDRLGTHFEKGKLSLSHGDVTSSDDVRRAMAKGADALGGLDGVVNAAGIDLLRNLEDTSDEEWRGIFAVNLDGPMRVCRAALPYLRTAGGGTIVNISSGAGLMPLKHRTAYSASKAGLQMFSKALAMEAADFGVRVNAICPGAVETGLLRSSIDAAPDPQQAYEAVRARYALARIAEPDEIAAAVLWLSSPESSYVTGVALAVDGGRTFH